MNITEAVKKAELLEQKFIEFKASTNEVLAKFKRSAITTKHNLSSEAKKALEPYLTNQFWRKGNEEESL